MGRKRCIIRAMMNGPRMRGKTVMPIVETDSVNVMPVAAGLPLPAIHDRSSGERSATDMWLNRE